MAYTHIKYEVVVVRSIDVDTAADNGFWAPGYVPHIIRAVSLVWTTTVIGATGTFKVDKRPTAGSDTGRGDGDVAILNYTAALGVAGKVTFKDGLNVRINPGEEIVGQVTDATPTAGNADLVIFVEPVWERPDNNTDMVVTT